MLLAMLCYPQDADEEECAFATWAMRKLEAKDGPSRGTACALKTRTRDMLRQMVHPGTKKEENAVVPVGGAEPAASKENARK